ncbi:MAG TPA: FAD-dependent oxidoreductase, partial [Mycobacteriales bacterium]|nr:FAD-dependent oxidoreductase [Mycobacteriales bacterium]
MPGEDLEGVVSALTFLEAVKRGEPADLGGARAVVVGGGNVAMDAARTARRLGAAQVLVAYRRGREEMPAHEDEIEAAAGERARFLFQVAPVEVVGDEHGRVAGLRCVRTQLGVPDASGRRRPEPIPGSEFVVACDTVIAAVGLTPDTAAFGDIATTRGGTVEADPDTLQTAVPWVFAVGDVVSGALDIAHAVGRGQRAAHAIDTWLRTGQADATGFDVRLPVADKAATLARRPQPAHHERLADRATVDPEPHGFDVVEPPLSEEEARQGAARCLDCGLCSECGQCVAVCEANAIDLTKPDREVELQVGAIVAATGFKPFDARRVPEYGYGTYPDVYTSLEVERLLNASGPTQGQVVLRSGGKPRTVGIIHCVGSRDVRYNSYCSRVCCMYSLKLAHLLKERTGADIYNFYIDMRTPGKGYEEFYGKVGKDGVHFIRGRVAEVSAWAMSPAEEGKLVIRAEDTLASTVRRIPVDMVVLSVALEPQADADAVSRLLNITRGPEGFFTERHPKLAPVSTFTDGVFLAGVCQGPKDIPDTVAQAGAALPRCSRWSAAGSSSWSRGRRTSTSRRARAATSASACARSARCRSTPTPTPPSSTRCCARGAASASR